MNYIFIDGAAVYVFVFLIIILGVIGLFGISAMIVGDYKREKLQEELYEEQVKNLFINRENMRLKLKCDEFVTGEKKDV